MENEIQNTAPDINPLPVPSISLETASLPKTNSNEELRVEIDALGKSISELAAKLDDLHKHVRGK